ncbi:MAG: Bax inhibitor-1 family protein, partial [Deltaproteobacteria bacterium]|nr:Bax inhibitor-1 family protein [Deltaproteobacteria bacterium]
MQDFTNPPQIQGYAPQAVQAETSEALFFQRVYMWMCGGLLVTAAVAVGIFNSSFRNVVASRGGLLVLILLAQFGLVLAIGVLARRLPVAAVRGLFLLYAASMGITVSLFLVIYPSNVIFKAFLSASAVYAGMAAYGLLTKRSLQRL